MVRLIRDNRVVYQAYFEKSEDLLLVDAPLSFEVYRRAFTGVKATSPAVRIACRFDGPGDTALRSAAQETAQPTQEELSNEP